MAEGFCNGTCGPWRPGHRAECRPRQQWPSWAAATGKRSSCPPPCRKRWVPKNSGRRGINSAIKWTLALNQRQIQKQRRAAKRALNPRTAGTPGWPAAAPQLPGRRSVPSTPLTYAAGCQLYFCLRSLPKENQPLSSSVAQPVRSGAEARIRMSDWVDSPALISSCTLNYALRCAEHTQETPRALNQPSTSRYLLCKTPQNTEEPERVWRLQERRSGLLTAKGEAPW